MKRTSRGILTSAFTLALASVILLPASTPAQSSSTAQKDQWIHVRVESKDEGGESVRVNVPVEMAEKILPVINKDQLHNGKVHLDSADMKDLDLRNLWDVVRTSKDGEYVTVESKENNVRVAKTGGYLLIHVTDKSKENSKSKTREESKVEIKVPMKVVDAMFSAGKDELDIVAALRALSSFGDTELVSVKDSENTVRVWIDSKNIAD